MAYHAIINIMVKYKIWLKVFNKKDDSTDKDSLYLYDVYR